MLEINRIYNEDCLEGLKRLDGKSVDLIVTDPPYDVHVELENCSTKISKSVAKAHTELSESNIISGFDEKILDEFMRVMKVPNIYIWCNAKQIPMYLDYFYKKHNCNYDFLFWWKTNAPPLINNKYLTDKKYCLYFRKNGYCHPDNYENGATVYKAPMNKRDKEIWGHPTIKPLPFIETMIKNSSHKGDLILDAFMGSGTTAVAAVNTDRDYIGFEINKKFYNTACKRIEEAKNMRDLHDFLSSKE
ncbi:MAG: site-specific DNA-methyltransferase [Oscillospiraceae bacterium]|jgi:DNA modification methylase|nr:site-specific DNA-methyltransferase [Oscillospiraceae bacterium]